MSYRDWVVSALNDTIMNPQVAKTTALGDRFIEIQTTVGKTVIVGVIDKANITGDDVKEVCESAPKTPNVVISKKTAIWTGSAIDYSRQQNIGWGGLGEVSLAFYRDEYGYIQKREYEFVEQGLLNHTRVMRLERIYDRIFKIHRTGDLMPLTIVLINSYELSGDEVRHAISKYGKFDTVLKTNPNGSPTANAYSAAGEINADIFHWRELLGRLNKK